MSQCRHLTLWCPNLLEPKMIFEAQEVLSQAKVSCLKKMLTKCDYHYRQNKSYESLASYLFHQEYVAPSAATCVKVECDLSPAQADFFWLHVDPVQMIADRDTLVLIPGEDLQITFDESQQLLKSFNAHFKQDGIELVMGTECSWYISMPQMIDISTTPKSEVVYQSVNNCYPSGSAGNYWRQLINETQMLFYTHPVNEHRRSQGLPEINSIWIWGEGQLDRSQIIIRNKAQMISTTSYLKGLAALTGSDFVYSVNDFEHWRQKSDKYTHSMVELTFDQFGLSPHEFYLENWISHLENLETHWFEPIFNSLKSGELESVFFVLGANKHFHMTSSHFYRFWRLGKRWSAIVS